MIASILDWIVQCARGLGEGIGRMTLMWKLALVALGSILLGPFKYLIPLALWVIELASDMLTRIEFHVASVNFGTASAGWNAASHYIGVANNFMPIGVMVTCFTALLALSIIRWQIVAITMLVKFLWELRPKWLGI